MALASALAVAATHQAVRVTVQPPRHDLCDLVCVYLLSVVHCWRCWQNSTDLATERPRGTPRLAFTSTGGRGREESLICVTAVSL